MLSIQGVVIHPPPCMQLLLAEGICKLKIINFFSGIIIAYKCLPSMTVEKVLEQDLFQGFLAMHPWKSSFSPNCNLMWGGKKGVLAPGVPSIKLCTVIFYCCR